jgi:hypothetical protein
MSEIRDSHDADNEDYSILGCDAVQSGKNKYRLGGINLLAPEFYI